jgi:hypothetical protein
MSKEIFENLTKEIERINAQNGGTSCIQWKRWADAEIRRFDLRVLDSKEEEGAGKKVLFTPFYGEFGWKIMFALRLVHFSKAKYKIVCAQKGEEALYPTANEFFYDWVNPIPDKDRAGTFRDNTINFPDIYKLYPDAIPVRTGGLSFTQEAIPYHPGPDIDITPKIIRRLDVDICIGTRRREMCPDKNYQHYPAIADYLNKRGITFAIIGNRETSFPLTGMKYMSGDYDDLNSAIELLQNCKLYVGQDSGGAHLASLCKGSDMIVQIVRGDKHRRFIGHIIENTNRKVTLVHDSYWENPQGIIDEIKKYFPETVSIVKPLVRKPGRPRGKYGKYKQV